MKKLQINKIPKISPMTMLISCLYHQFVEVQKSVPYIFISISKLYFIFSHSLPKTVLLLIYLKYDDDDIDTILVA